ncbi:winged helix-turn-helix transcriptional regulator [Agrobacterium rosae]|uniref:winged helix-turn-helix transcriptional regulator n=1 Tax=Agrobacterium rosae TaxID=1972867 RepID=UPI003A806CEC
MSQQDQSGLPKFLDSDHSQCQIISSLLDRVGDKWTVMVVGVLADGPVRFNAIMREVGGVSHRMLTLTLRGLERDGIVERRAFPTIPPKVEYELTPLGQSLVEPLEQVMNWVRLNQEIIEKARGAFDARPSTT